MSQQDEVPSSEEAKARLAEFEKNKMTRRNLLARFGFKAAAAAVAALTADDLLRAVGKEMERRAGDNEVAQRVAQEFKNAGVAFAGPSACISGCNGDCTCLCNCTKQTCVANACRDFPGCCDSNNVPLGTCTGGFPIRILACENNATTCVLNCPD